MNSTLSTKAAAIWPKSLLLLAAGHLITDLSQGALPVLLPYLKDLFQLTYAQIGYIVLVQNLTSSVIQPLFGYLTDKKSLPWLLPCGVLLAGIGMSLMGFAPNYAVLLLIVIITGLGVASFHPQASKTTHFISTPETKGRNQGFFSVGGNLGFALGAVFMTYLVSLPGTLNNTLYYLVPGVAMALLLALNLKELSPSMAVSKAGAGEVTGRSRFDLLFLLLFFIFIRSSIHTGLTTYIPLYYMHYLSGSPIYASFLLSFFLLAGVVGTYAGGYLSDKIGRKNVLLFSMAASLPLLVLLPHTSGILTLIDVTLLGAVLISSFATSIVLAQELMPRHVGMASGLTIGFSIGLGGLGATVLGYVADHFGVPAVFTLLSFLPLLGLISGYFLPKNTRSATANA